MPRAWYQEPLVWMLLAIPLTSVAVGAVMLWLAFKSEDGLVVDDYYKHGLEINRTLQRDRVAGDYSLRSHIEFTDDLGNIAITLEAVGDFPYPSALTLGLHHATRAEYDRTVNLTRTGANTYHGVGVSLAAGRWYLDLGEDEWRLTGNIVWPIESTMLRAQ